MATAAALGHAEMPAERDSISFLPALLGQNDQQTQHEFLYWEFHEQGFKQAALYQGRWKGIRANAPDAPIVLFDLQNDVAEKTDVAAKHPEIVNKIDAYLQQARTASADWKPAWRPNTKL